ncbi:hypothetical protein [Pseudomonas sp. L1(2025)]|uniref:hypothetical protein n=1 Tax=Pseudomonas sp. L1(2025) TaxID=3449429 RepID=UPI003F690A49
MDIGAINRMMDMLRAQQSLDELSAWDAEPSQKEQDETRRRTEFELAGSDDSNRQIQF